ncbi:MAG TPA: YajQ family cyclic di-GMP-binding protein [Dehalococcoidia bacterium]|nr:YajQ family cyclic di-GMP-binding protein [Dehalococcoidia bacterium]
MAAAESSFDVVSQFDRQEVVNAIDQAMREVQTRYDLKDTKSRISLEKDQITFSAPSEFVLKAVRELLEGKLVRRNLSLKILDYGKVEPAAGNTVRQVAKFRQGIDQDLARQITKLIRDRSPKVRSQVQGDAVRVSAKSKDDLQAVIRLLKEQDYPVDLQFINYR